jgi:hypothetical protein
MSSSDVVYYNITIATTSVGVDTVNASIVAQNTLPILDNPSEYYGSIVRLNTPQFEIPLAYFDVEVDSSGNVPDINRGVYKFTVAWGSVTASGVLTTVSSNTQNVMWEQQDFTASPIPINGQPKTQSNYYFVYDYETVINLWNKAIATAYATVQSAVGAPLVVNQPPFFYYNPNTQVIELYSVQSYSEYTNSGNFLQLFSNDIMQPLIHGFKYFIINNAPKSILFNIQSYPNSMTPLNNVSFGMPAVNYIKVQQEYVSLNYWNMLRNIYITTTMPVQQEGYYIGNSNNFIGQNLLLQSTLTDYIPDLTGGQQAGVAGSQFIYNASSLWRIFQLNSHTPLYNFSASIFFADQNNYIWPLALFTKQQVNIKFMFIKKHLISNLLKSKV